MPLEWSALSLTLAFVWFLVYWIGGGVFFALMAILRLGRVRKVRFSCLFTLVCLGTAAISASAGLRFSRTAIAACLERAESRTETLGAVFGCGFAGVMGSFLLGAAVIILGGFVVMAVSRSTQRPWIILHGNDGEGEGPPSDAPPVDGGVTLME